MKPHTIEMKPHINGNETSHIFQLIPKFECKVLFFKYKNETSR